MSTLTGKNWAHGFRYDAHGKTRQGWTDDEMLGALDAPGCIAAGSTVPSENLAQGRAAITVLVRKTGVQSTVNVDDIA